MQRALGGRAGVTDDVVDQRVVQQIELFQRRGTLRPEESANQPNGKMNTTTVIAALLVCIATAQGRSVRSKAPLGRVTPYTLK